jgi:hypothetical protein
MAKHEHMSAASALTHAALIGHVIRGTVLEGKSFGDAHADARSAVGDASDAFQRQPYQDPSSQATGPMIDEAFYPVPAGSLDINSGDLFDTSGKPLVGPAANRVNQEARLAEQDRSWRAFHSVHSPGARIAPP